MIPLNPYEGAVRSTGRNERVPVASSLYRAGTGPAESRSEYGKCGKELAANAAPSQPNLEHRSGSARRHSLIISAAEPPRDTAGPPGLQNNGPAKACIGSPAKRAMRF